MSTDLFIMQFLNVDYFLEVCYIYIYSLCWFVEISLFYSKLYDLLKLKRCK